MINFTYFLLGQQDMVMKHFNPNNYNKIKVSTFSVIKGITSFRYILLTIVSVICFDTNIWGSSSLATKLQIGMFLNSETCVVPENSPVAYNVYIHNAVEKNWKITKYEFIDQKDRFNLNNFRDIK